MSNGTLLKEGTLKKKAGWGIIKSYQQRYFAVIDCRMIGGGITVQYFEEKGKAMKGQIDIDENTVVEKDKSHTHIHDTHFLIRNRFRNRIFQMQAESVAVCEDWIAFLTPLIPTPIRVDHIRIEVQNSCYMLTMSKLTTEFFLEVSVQDPEKPQMFITNEDKLIELHKHLAVKYETLNIPPPYPKGMLNHEPQFKAGLIREWFRTLLQPTMSAVLQSLVPFFDPSNSISVERKILTIAMLDVRNLSLCRGTTAPPSAVWGKMGMSCDNMHSPIVESKKTIPGTPWTSDFLCIHVEDWHAPPTFELSLYNTSPHDSAEFMVNST